MSKVIELAERKNMPKTVTVDSSEVVKALEVLLDYAKKGELENFILAGFAKDDAVMYVKASNEGMLLTEQQHLVSFLQTQMTIETIETML